jgi:formate-dependent nitrite reductase cytochrome c552 subunit
MPFDCAICHEGAANHGGNMANKTTVHFDLEVCGSTDCHPDQYGTYIYGDDWKTKYGGSPGPDAVKQLPYGNQLPYGDTVLWNKLDDFGNYNDIIDGYGFTKEYNEERSHNVMMEDHRLVTRFKFDTCLQCKSTKVAYYWGDESVGYQAKERTIENKVVVKAGHMTGYFPDGLTVPGGTTVKMETARGNSHEAQITVTLPNGTIYASNDYPVDKTTKMWTWSALYALTVNELAPDAPTRLSGNGCNHCHDPHRVGNKNGRPTGFRIIRKSLIQAIERDDLIGNDGGSNPYDAGSSSTFMASFTELPLDLDMGIALCAQCHVEYVCGPSPIDKIDRDFFSWAKAFDLEDVYVAAFPGYGEYSDRKYIQDWIHGTGGLSSPNQDTNGVAYTDSANPIQEELIKSQHPEAETYWESRHYDNGAACFTCHMPKVTKTDGITTFTSHWMASPNKYMDPVPAEAFAIANSVELVGRDMIIPPCGACHGGKLSRMKDKATRIQDGIYADALVVQAALVKSLKAIKDAKDVMDVLNGPAVDSTLFEAAVEAHQAAHVRWENLVVSENSMGFHNPSEVSTELHNALALAQSAKQNAEDAVGAAPPPEPEFCYELRNKTSCNDPEDDLACIWSNKLKACEEITIP